MRRAALAAALAAAGLSATATDAADRSRPPVPAPARPLQPPSVRRLALSNGVPVHLVEQHEVPLVQVLVVVRAGAASDPPGRAGLAALTADMLDEGAGGKDPLALAAALEMLGARLSSGAAWDASLVSLDVPAARLEAALALLADVVLRPEFRPREWQRLRARALTELLQARADPDAVAAAALARAVFGAEHRYGSPLEGDARSVAALSLEELRACHASSYRPSLAALVVVGDVDARLPGLLEAAFGAWKEPAAPARAAVPLAAPRAPARRRVVLVDRPDAPQSTLRVGSPGPARGGADHHDLLVLNALLGGAFTSRLNDNLREQHGYAYGAASELDQRLAGGLFHASADVHTEATAPALAEIFKELGRIRGPAPADEVARIRSSVALGYAAEFETTGQIAAKLADQLVYGLPPDAFATFVPRVLAVDPAALRKAAQRTIHPERMAVVVVGDRQRIEAPVKALGLGPLQLLTVDDVMGPPPAIP